VKSLVAFDLSAAATHNRFWAGTRQRVRYGAKRLVQQGQGWGPLLGAIGAWVFGEYDPPPSWERFAQLVAHWQQEQGGLAVNGILSRTPWRRMRQQAAQGLPPEFASPVDGLRRPHGWDELIATFGDPRTLSQSAWEAWAIGAARAPGRRQFQREDGSMQPSLPLHRALAPHAEAFFAAVDRGGLWDELQPVGRAYAWDPAGASLHAWGVAFDVRPSQYPPARRPVDYPGPEHYPPGYLLRHLQAFGWHWGLWWDLPHPGHFQFATGVEGC
jgi:hypothetical protein